MFARNARYSREELLGAPHNIIRHPDMPGAIFKATWDLLADEHPVCAYVKNLAKDGSTYWAFATIVPIAGRFLSVRATPCDLAARDLFESLYDTVRAAERTARERGAGAREAAEIGGDVLRQALADNGFASYTDLQLIWYPSRLPHASGCAPRCPTCLTARRRPGRSSSRSLMRAASSGSFAADIAQSLTLADALGRDLRRLRTALAALGSEVEAVARSATGMPPSPDTAGGSAGSGGAGAVALVPVIRSQLHGRRSDGVSKAADELGGVVRVRKQLALSSAIARMQAEAIGRYVVAVEAGTEDGSPSGPCRA